MVVPRNVFLSFDHKQDSAVATDFERSFREQCKCFRDPSSMRQQDDASSGHLSDDCLEQIERSTVLFVLVGPTTASDPFVDWEIRQSLYRGHGLVILQRSGTRYELPLRAQDNVDSGFSEIRDWPTQPKEMRAILDPTANPEIELIENDRKPAAGRPPRAEG